MNEKFFPELARRLRAEDVAAGQAEKDRLPVLLGGQKVMWVESQGGIVLKANAVDDPKANRIYETVRQWSIPVYKYTEAMASAPVLEAVGLHEEFRLLAKYDGVVLAGQGLEGDWGYKFATWRRSLDGASLDHGNYFHNDYEEAKLDFACRSGLVRYTRQFTDEQLIEMYRCIHETLESGYPLTKEQENKAVPLHNKPCSVIVIVQQEIPILTVQRQDIPLKELHSVLVLQANVLPDSDWIHSKKGTVENFNSWVVYFHNV